MRTIALVFVLASAAHAQDTPRDTPPPAYMPQPAAIEYMKEPPDNNAKQRGKGAMFITLGAVMIPIGIALLGTSALVWDGYSTSSCSYSCQDYTPYLAGGLVMDVMGTLIFAGGATMLALGAQKYVEYKKPARFAFTGNGFRF